MSLEEWDAIRLTVQVSITALLCAIPIAIPVAWLLAKRDFAGKFLLETLVNLPLVLPPVVTGYLLLLLLGRRGPMGDWLESQLGVRFVFDWKGAAIAAAVMSFPLLVRPIRQAFLAIDHRMLKAAQLLGAKPWNAFVTIALPLAAPGILSGAMLALARNMGEFGATMMIAGNTAGQTRTIPLFIYAQLDKASGMRGAIRLVLASIAISTLALLIGQWLERYNQRRLEGAVR
jgi:molybdate transport system permease protein